ncbi:MAG TPA: hypothetical protein VKB32_09510 [Actinomycetota bacterium]|nr:hypothetical protein [Actinomycetota bacterium]
MRAKVLVDLVGLSLVGSACSNGAGSDPPVQDPRAGARLDALGERWMTTVATITYRTKGRDPGEATSPHQCLIQFVGDTFDRQTGVMLCSGTGEMRLAWGAFRPVADGRGVCRWEFHVVVRVRRVRPLPVRWSGVGVHRDREARSVRSARRAPAQTLEELETAVVTAEGPRTIAGMRAECFHAMGGSADAVRRVVWCFSPGGLLLSLFDGIQDGRVRSAEATHVSPGVSASDFVTPTR